MMLPRLVLVAFLYSQPRRRIAPAVTAALCLPPANLSLNAKNQPPWLASSISGTALLASPRFFLLPTSLSRHTALVPVLYSNSKLPLTLA